MRQAAIGLGAALAMTAAVFGMERVGGGVAVTAGAVTAGIVREGDKCAFFDHVHEAWTAVLRRYVKDGFVDYAGLKRDGASDLFAYLESLASICGGHYDTWKRGQKLAFWINAYNAYTVKLILDHYPLKSIRSIGLLPGAAFREEFIALPKLGRPRLSLNAIEHDILRREFSEARIHFAIVCASKSCPALRSDAYRASGLDGQLDDAARAFLQDTAKNRFDAASRTLYLSSIFQWFHEDFERAAGSVPAFVARTLDPGVSAKDVRVKHLDYDWSLNGR